MGVSRGAKFHVAPRSQEALAQFEEGCFRHCPLEVSPFPLLYQHSKESLGRNRSTCSPEDDNGQFKEMDFCDPISWHLPPSKWSFVFHWNLHSKGQQTFSRPFSSFQATWEGHLATKLAWFQDSHTVVFSIHLLPKLISKGKNASRWFSFGSKASEEQEFYVPVVETIVFKGFRHRSISNNTDNVIVGTN